MGLSLVEEEFEGFALQVDDLAGIQLNREYFERNQK